MMGTIATIGSRRILAALGIAMMSAGASGQVQPFTETFETGANGWTDSAFQALATEPTGGPDGSAFASGSFNFKDFQPVPPVGGTVVMIRGSAGNNASGGAFIGDWIASGIDELSVFVRHDAPQPLSYFLRAATPLNFPGGLILAPVPVAPGVWTELTFDISPDNPLFIGEGPDADFATVFGNVGNVQFGIDGTPLAGLDQEVSFDVDSISIVPSPGTGVLTLAGLLAAGRRRRGLMA